MYLQIKVQYINNYSNFTSIEREAQIMAEMQIFSEDVETISESMSKVCNFFHAVRSLPKQYKFSPGNNLIFLFTFIE